MLAKVQCYYFLFIRVLFEPTFNFDRTLMAELWRQRNLETDKRKTVRSMLIKIEPRKERELEWMRGQWGFLMLKGTPSFFYHLSNCFGKV
jgi:hypothetical protein